MPASLACAQCVPREAPLELLLSEESAIASDLEAIFAAHHGLVFRTAYRITGNAADAEDVLQTVFMRLMKRSASAPAVESIESYLRRAAVNAALDVVRARQSMAAMPLEDMPSRAAGIDPGEMRSAIRRGVAGLSPRAAEIFALRYFEGYSNREIARSLGISQVLTAVTLHRARRQLQKELKAYLGGKS